jgi:hypothetical protein
MRLSSAGSGSKHMAASLLCFGLILCSLAVGQTPNDAKRKAWPQEPEDFKGLKFGMTVEEVRKFMPFGQYACSSMDGEYFCRYPSDPFVFWITFKAGKFTSLTGDFEPSMFGVLEEAFTSKYGKPQDAENSTVQNRAGATFQQRELTWTGDTFTIRLERYGSKVTEGFLSVRSTRDVLESRRQLEEKSKHILDK